MRERNQTPLLQTTALLNAKKADVPYWRLVHFLPDTVIIHRLKNLSKPTQPDLISTTKDTIITISRTKRREQTEHCEKNESDSQM